jgi:DNA-binding transcriptional regulator GbsR (MarR family)
MTSFQPFSEDFVDMFLPSSVRMKKVMMRLQSQLEELLMQNIENLRWSIFQSIDRFFIKFKNFFEKYFSMLIGSTSTFIEDLLKEKQQQKFIDEKVKMLEQKKFSLLEIKKNLIKNRI